MKLHYVNCTICKNCKTYSFAKNAVCIYCTKKQCRMSHYSRCNNLYDFCNGENLCSGHYKYMQQFCKICGIQKMKSETLCYDNWYYCENHLPIMMNKRTFEIIRILKHNNAPIDILNVICKYLNKSSVNS